MSTEAVAQGNMSQEPRTELSAGETGAVECWRMCCRFEVLGRLGASPCSAGETGRVAVQCWGDWARRRAVLGDLGCLASNSTWCVLLGLDN